MTSATSSFRRASRTRSSVFEVGSTHKGTVVSIDGSNVGVALPYGGRILQAKHLNADGTEIKVEESADFIVLEFNRNAKRITVSLHYEPPAKKRGARTTGSSATTATAVRARPRSVLREMNERQAKTVRRSRRPLQLKEQMEGAPAAELPEEPRRRRSQLPRRSPPRKAEGTAEEAPAAEEVAAEVAAEEAGR